LYSHAREFEHAHCDRRLDRRGDRLGVEVWLETVERDRLIVDDRPHIILLDRHCRCFHRRAHRNALAPPPHLIRPVGLARLSGRPGGLVEIQGPGETSGRFRIAADEIAFDLIENGRGHP
jgi:hypothetical protein